MRLIHLKLALSVIILLSSYSFGQLSFHDITSPCDSLDNQSGMNQCAHKKFQLVDSMMEVKYQSILEILNADIDHYKLKKDSEMVEYSSDLLQIIIKSQEIWSQIADQHAKFYSRAYEGGSMRSMTISNSRIVDMLERIERLEELRLELSQ